LNVGALIAVAVFAGVLLAIFGALYVSASRSHARGELGTDGLRILRWAFLGHLTLYALLAVTAFIT
jgi:hypothetical protein